MTSHKLPGDEPAAHEGFLSRWSRRKRGSPSEQDATERSSRRDLEATPSANGLPAPPGAEDRDAVADVTDADLPPLEALDENSDYSGFMSRKVSVELRRAALRKLFHQPKFNIRDRLDCHVGDFTKFEPLGDTITADMHHQIERAARDKVNQTPNKTPVDDRVAHPNQESDQARSGAAPVTAPESSDEACADHSVGRAGEGEERPA